MSSKFETLYDTFQRKQMYKHISNLMKQKLNNDRKGNTMATAKTTYRKPVAKPTAKRARQRLNPDSRSTLIAAVFFVFVLMISSFIVSFNGIYDVSAWTGLPVFLQWLPALFIDAAIIAYTISLIVFKARGESTWRTTLGLFGFALMSVVANISHTLSFWDGSLGDYKAWVGVFITASAPIAVLLASEEITRLAFAKPKRKVKKIK